MWYVSTQDGFEPSTFGLGNRCSSAKLLGLFIQGRCPYARFAHYPPGCVGVHRATALPLSVWADRLRRLYPPTTHSGASLYRGVAPCVRFVYSLRWRCREPPAGVWPLRRGFLSSGSLAQAVLWGGGGSVLVSRQSVVAALWRHRLGYHEWQDFFPWLPAEQ